MLIQNLHVVANLEFLMVLSNVFMSALPTDESASAAIPAIQQTSQAIIKELPVTVKPADEEPLNVDVQINIRDPEIAVLADAKDTETNALFMKVTYQLNGTPRCSSRRNLMIFVSLLVLEFFGFPLCSNPWRAKDCWRCFESCDHICSF